jgi:hypothetical protein
VQALRKKLGLTLTSQKVDGERNRGTFLEARHRLLERHYVGRQPFADIRQHGSASWWFVPPGRTPIGIHFHMFR